LLFDLARIKNKVEKKPITKLFAPCCKNNFTRYINLEITSKKERSLVNKISM